MLAPTSIISRVWTTTIVTLATLLILDQESSAQDSLRIATYNASLYGKAAGQVRERLADAADAQAQKIAAIIQTIRPDLLLINEIDYDSDAATAKLLAEKFFAISQGGRKPIEYPYVYAVASNTGIDSGLDLNHNGVLRQPNDAWGYGVYPGQYSMAIYSRYPIDVKAVRTFQRFLWKDFPDALRPVYPDTNKSYYDDATWNALRLSSKNHVDVPIMVGEQTIHILASHPTPPVFDGKEDRNGCRNHDEIRFWVDYLEGSASTHLVDDRAGRGGLEKSASFVILGDLNSDPSAGDSRQEAIHSLLAHRRLIDPQPSSNEEVEASKAAGNTIGEFNTASFGRKGMRVDYVLPSRSLTLKHAGVFWPKAGEKNHDLVSASDHRMVWVEVELP